MTNSQKQKPGLPGFPIARVLARDSRGNVSLGPREGFADVLEHRYERSPEGRNHYLLGGFDRALAVQARQLGLRRSHRSRRMFSFRLFFQRELMECSALADALNKNSESKHLWMHLPEAATQNLNDKRPRRMSTLRTQYLAHKAGLPVRLRRACMLVDSRISHVCCD